MEITVKKGFRMTTGVDCNHGLRIDLTDEEVTELARWKHNAMFAGVLKTRVIQAAVQYVEGVDNGD